MAWKKLSSKKVYENRYMKVLEEKLLTEQGETLTYGIVEKQPAVWVIPYNPETNQVLLVGQTRHAVNFFSWEFPAGHAEANKPEVAARLELKEETGLITDSFTPIGDFYIAPGHLTQRAFIFVATEFVQGERELETSEADMKQKWVNLDEVKDMIQNGSIKDSPTITSFKFFELYLASKKSGV
jgi:8-oxo-dGTP pyrophosphatase MutT (NUDIX family)